MQLGAWCEVPCWQLKHVACRARGMARCLIALCNHYSGGDPELDEGAETSADEGRRRVLIAAAERGGADAYCAMVRSEQRGPADSQNHSMHYIEKERMFLEDWAPIDPASRLPCCMSGRVVVPLMAASRKDFGFLQVG